MREACLNQMQIFYHERGYISILGYRNANLTPSADQIIQTFGTWKTAVNEAGIPEQANVNGYSKEDVILSLQRFYRETGSTARNVYESTKAKPTKDIILKFFGSWNNALAVAGIKEASTSSASECISAIQRFKKEHGSTDYASYQVLGYIPSTSKIIKEFGSWNSALEAAGIETDHKRFTKEDCLQAIKSFYAETGSNSKFQYAKGQFAPGYSTICAMFGSWRKALGAAGIKIGNKSVTKKDCIRAIEYFYVATGSLNRVEYAKGRNSPTDTTICDFFGSWENALFEAFNVTKNENDLGVNSGRKRNYTQTDAIDAIKQFKEQHGIINKTLYHLSGYKPSISTIEKLWGSWDCAIQESKIEEGFTKYRMEDCLLSMKKCYLEKGSIKLNVYKHGNYKPSASTIITLFGSWNNAMKIGGFTLNSTRGRGGMWSREDCIQSIINYHSTYGSINSTEYRKSGWKPALRVIQSNLGSWKDALLEAEILKEKDTDVSLETGSVNKEEPGVLELGYSEETCLKAIRDFYDKYGKTSNLLYRASKFKPSYAYITKKLGSWNNVLKLAGINPDTPSLNTN